MANSVLGKSLGSDWFFLGQDFAVRTIPRHGNGPTRVFFFWSEAGKFKICNQAKKIVNIVILHSEATRRS